MRLRRPGRKTFIAAGGVLAMLMLIGWASDLGDGMSQDAAKAAKEDSTISVAQDLPPAPPSATVITRVNTVNKLPESCTHYLDLVDTTIQSVYDYENGIAPAEGALSDGLGALVDGDAEQLNKARTELNHVQNDTTGPLQTIVASHGDLVAAHAACQKDLGR